MFASPCTPPIPNSYWVEPGRLLAGEYPGSMSRTDAMERLQKLLRAGIDSFIDLTEDGELPVYDNLLPSLIERDVHYRRMPIVDHGLPDSPAHMTQILDLIASELAAGRCLYVHCHAGIGRTGMAMACHLIRGGLPNVDALRRLQELWQQSARSRRWPSVPETPQQVEYVQQWREPPLGASAAATDARAEGALVGLALAEALAASLATGDFDAATLAAGLRDTRVLATGVHAAMARAVGDSLLAASGHDPQDQMVRYLQWVRSAGDVPIPTELKRALGAWQWSRKPQAGSHDPRNLDPHTLPRTLAVALYAHADAAAAIDLAAEVSRTTQQAPLVLDLCRLWAALLVDALHGADKSTLLALRGPALQLLRARALKKPLRGYLDAAVSGQGGRPAEANPGHDAMYVTQVAIAAFAETRTLRDALIRVATLRSATPAAAALCGALAGAHYGSGALPAQWCHQLAEDAVLRALARRLSA